MKVDASMSTRILKDGELWGLIACHHRQPKYLSYELCSVFEMMSNMITAKISAVQNKDLLAYRAEKLSGLVDFMQSVYRQSLPASYKYILLSLLEADGIAVVMDDQIETAGAVPSLTEIGDLVFWLSSNELKATYTQSSLTAAYEPAERYAETASGLMALPLDEKQGNFILAFRKEAVQKLSWGGNPSEAVQFEADGKKYHPRASF
jgi:light-regulated signal transduction histidine kinase (bacteriophytochrome)